LEDRREIVVRKSVNVILSPFSALTLLVGQKENIRPVKKVGVGLLVVMI